MVDILDYDIYISHELINVHGNIPFRHRPQVSHLDFLHKLGGHTLSHRMSMHLAHGME
jgi:hypothetical protein